MYIPLHSWKAKTENPTYHHLSPPISKTTLSWVTGPQMSPSAINLMTISAMKITAKTSHSTKNLAERARKNTKPTCKNRNRTQSPNARILKETSCFFSRGVSFQQSNKYRGLVSKNAWWKNIMILVWPPSLDSSDHQDYYMFRIGDSY